MQSIKEVNKSLWYRTRELFRDYEKVKGLTSKREFTRASVKVLRRLAVVRREYYFDVADKTIARLLNYSGMQWAYEVKMSRPGMSGAKTFKLVPKSLYNYRTENRGDRVKIAMNPVNKLDMIHRGLLPPTNDGLHFTFPTFILDGEHIFTANPRNYGYTDWEAADDLVKLDNAAKAWRFLHEFLDNHKVESLTLDNCGVFMHTFSTFCTTYNYLHIIEWHMTSEIVNKLAPDMKPLLFKKLLVHEVIEIDIADALKLYIGPEMFSNVSVEFVRQNAEAINLVTARLARPTIIWKIKELMKNRVNKELDMASNV